MSWRVRWCCGWRRRWGLSWCAGSSGDVNSGTRGGGGSGASGFAVIKISATQNKIAVFSNTATWNVPAGVSSIEYLIVAGGGGGGSVFTGSSGFALVTK